MSAAHHCRMSVSGLQNLMTSEGRNADDLAAFGALNDRITTSGTCFYCCRTLTVVEINSFHREVRQRITEWWKVGHLMIVRNHYQQLLKGPSENQHSITNELIGGS